MAVAVYSNTLNHGFVFDDIEGILNNKLVLKFDGLSQVMPFLREAWRPLTQFSYALTHVYFGFDPRVFHAFNIFVHAVNSLLVFGIGTAAARLWLPAEKREWFGLAAGLIFAVHPMHTEAVAYVWGRSSSLCALFYFGALLLVMRGSREADNRQKMIWYACAVVAGFLSWKSKEEAITLPFLVAGFFFLVRSWRGVALSLLAPLFIVISRWADIGRLYSQVGENRQLVAAGAERSLGFWQYFFTQIKYAVFYYLRRFVVPSELNADPAANPVTSPADPLLIVSIFVLVCLAACAVLASRRGGAVSFGLMALLISPLTSYSVMPLADLLAEHRVYIAGLGIAILAAVALTLSSRITLAGLALATMGLGVLTYQRNEVWANGVTLWRDAALKSPGLARPHLNLGVSYQAEGQTDAALVEYQWALAVNPKLAPAYINMSAIYFSHGDLDACKASLAKAVELSPNLAAPYINLAIIELRQGQPDRAIALLDRAGAIDDSHIVHFNKGEAFFQLRRWPDALREYRRAVELKPDLRELKEQVDQRIRQMREAGAIP